jgi:hypothetical protein
LLEDRAAIEARLADLFLELVLDRDAEVAFVRGVQAEEAAAPQVVRTQRLTLIQTAVLLHLRQLLVRAAPGERVIVGMGEVAEHMEIYRTGQGIDRATLAKRVSGAWEKMHNFGLLHKTSSEGRSEISPALRLVFGPEQIEQLTAEYRRISAGGAEDAGGDGDGAGGSGAGVAGGAEAVGADGDGTETGRGQDGADGAGANDKEAGL